MTLIITLSGCALIVAAYTIACLLEWWSDR